MPGFFIYVLLQKKIPNRTLYCYNKEGNETYADCAAWLKQDGL